MPRMKILAAILLSLVTIAIPASLADWQVDSRTPQAGPAGLAFERLEVSSGDKSAEIYAVTFSPKTHTFAVMDNPAGAFDTESAAMKRGAAAAVNGGYFQPDNTPLGLVVRQGVQIHPMEHSRLLSGIVVVSGSRIALQRVGEFKPSPAIREALQAGPFLVDRGAAVPGLEATRNAARTVAFTDASGHFGVLVARNTTLADMAAILSTPGLLAGGKITRALNLDGGSSSALWVRGNPAFYSKEWKTVRTYLAIIAR